MYIITYNPLFCNHNEIAFLYIHRIKNIKNTNKIQTKFERMKKMTGLVLEGGTFRGIFSAGAMDAFLKQGIRFPYVVGVSAGISNGLSYISEQFERNIIILEKYRNDKRYLGVRNFADCKSYFGMNFVFGQIPQKLVPFDYERFHEYDGTVLIGATNAKTGKAEYFNALDDDENFQFLRATCAIPGYFPAIKINGQDYYDGGLASPICIKKAIKDGCTKNIIILTQPSGFVKKCGKGNIFMSQAVKHKYPALEMLLLTRHKLYNSQVKFCEELERHGKAIILRPDSPLESFQKDTSKLRDAWQHGYDSAMSRIEEIREFVNE